MRNKIKIAVIGLGYVGLPLAVEFGKKYYTYGFDINRKRISQLKNIDKTEVINTNQIKSSKKIKFTHNTEDLRNCNLYNCSTDAN